jgi:NitT/TauT family transport system substrate-binding protein
MLVRLIAKGAPLWVVANLLANDPIELVVRDDVYASRKMSAKAPLGERLASMRGLRVGVAEGPRTRLRAMFAGVGMNADRDVVPVVVGGDSQNQAFGDHTVDALFCHTPFLERAVLEQHGRILVDLSSGEVPALAGRQIHTLVVRQDLARSQPRAVAGMVRAIARAEALLHADPDASVRALRTAVPEVGIAEARLLVALYGPAVPRTPAVSAEGIREALALFPAHRRAPDPASIRFSSFVEPCFARAASASASASVSGTATATHPAQSCPPQ